MFQAIRNLFQPDDECCAQPNQDCCPDGCCANPGDDLNQQVCCPESSLECLEPGSVLDLLTALDIEIRDVSDRAARLGVWLRVDGVNITGARPAVNSLADAVEFTRARVAVLSTVIDSLVDKLGARGV